MITLGINAAFHDSAAALIVDGVLVAAAEEERFTRIKHAKRPLPFSAWELPFNAIDFCLAHAQTTLGRVDHVAYSADPAALPGQGNGGNGAWQLPRAPVDLGQRLPPEAWDDLFTAHVAHAPSQLLDGSPHHLRARFADGRGARGAPRFRWHFVDHHLAHQASAFLAAPFDHCAVMTLDGRGEHASTTYGHFADGRYRRLSEVDVPHSLGLLYERVTEHLGFLRSSDEYKVMALAALGRPRFSEALRSRIVVGKRGRYAIAPLDPAALFGPARRHGEPLQQLHFDIAASLQCVLEDVVLLLARQLQQATGERDLALAGGVALNCLMNARIRDAGLFDAVWVQPAAGDAGTALGAALWIDARMRAARGRSEDIGIGPSAVNAVSAADIPLPRPWRMRHAYWGPAFDDAEIAARLARTRMPFRRVEDPGRAAAEMLAADRIIGWFQGAMEFGPRALGARSILASPVAASMQERLNALKDREEFRPVAPAVPLEDLADWFEPAAANGGAAPFMLFTYRARPERRARIPSACHADGTARVQTVAAADNERFHRLLKCLGGLTGTPVAINTSFNVRGEPIVCTPEDALHAFASTPLDALVLGDAVLEKPA